MNHKLFIGLMGVSDTGILYSPGNRYKIKLPFGLGFTIQAFLNKYFAYTGRSGTELLFRKRRHYYKIHSPKLVIK